ncbi:MAG: phenylalanyl-tRNA synthetase alpha chain [Patescibacteria group bacterium]|nr:phenylalanine--tRNA ligase subunit alpha [Candidatus Saccharibacteria bacterium]MDQ5963671.1 phenylalanyl-tRNA synthetase alpha chain [Patescibacteria group bacterium]
MKYENENIANVATLLNDRIVTLEQKAEILKAPELRQLYGVLASLPVEQRAKFGKELNDLKQALQGLVNASPEVQEQMTPIDVTAPFDSNVSRPALLPTEQGSIHPLMQELDAIHDIFYRMGFAVEESREIDDEYHMFESLNFPKGHPARDDYDTFKTVEVDRRGEPLVAPAHTSTMQNRMLKKYARNLEHDEPIAVVVPDRVFRNEDLDARHEHTFYQFEGIYVSKGVNIGNLIATLQTFLESYYGKRLQVRVNPYYFPFTEPSFEMALSCPFCDAEGCHICSQAGWIELLGCGMIHPTVLKMAGIDPQTYSGFAWGCGLERLVMMKYGVEDIRHFESGKLDFLRQFA